jgi:hypothetical protein
MTGLTKEFRLSGTPRRYRALVVSRSLRATRATKLPLRRVLESTTEPLQANQQDNHDARNNCGLNGSER